MAKNLEADPQRVSDLTSRLLTALNHELKDSQYNAIDVFMAVHSLHKLIVVDMALRWSIESNISPDKTYRSAELTWRKTMQDLTKEIKPLAKSPQ